MDKQPKPVHIRVKKYANRRLYDTLHSQYVNLRHIADLIKEGNTVEVIDASSGEDITKVILTQIILEEEKEQRNLLPTEFLHQIIQYGETTYEDFLSRTFEAYRRAQMQMESAFQGWFKPWFDPGASPQRELMALKEKIAELESRLAQEREAE